MQQGRLRNGVGSFNVTTARRNGQRYANSSTTRLETILRGTTQPL